MYCSLLIGDVSLAKKVLWYKWNVHATSGVPEIHWRLTPLPDRTFRYTGQIGRGFALEMKKSVKFAFTLHFFYIPFIIKRVHCPIIANQVVAR